MFKFMFTQRWRQWLARRSQCQARTGCEKRGRDRLTCRPYAELLEDRITPTIFFTNQLSHDQPLVLGSGLSNQEVEVIFWQGQQSQYPASSGGPFTSNQIQQMTTAIQQLLASPYLSGIPDSNGVTTFAGAITDNDPFPGQLSETSIQNEAAALGLPEGGNQYLYVFLTPTAWPTNYSTSNGRNWDHNFTGFCWDYNQNRTIDSGWSVDNVTLSLGHELAECMSDPGNHGYEVYHNITKSNPSGNAIDQICDGEPSNYFFREPNGVLVEPYYYGNADPFNNYFVVPDGSPDVNFVLYANNPGSSANSNEQTTGYQFTVGDLGITTPLDGQFSVSTTTLDLPWGGTQQELSITANGQTAQFDLNTITSVQFVTDLNMANTLTINGPLPAGVTFSTVGFPYPNFETVNIDDNSIPAPPGGHSIVLNGTSLTVDGSSVPSSLFGATVNLNGSNCTFTVQNTPDLPDTFTINSTGGNNTILVEGTSAFTETLTVNASHGDKVTVGQNGTIDAIFDNSVVVNGGNLTVDASKETKYQVPVDITNSVLSFGPEPGQVVSVEYSGLDQLTFDGGPGVIIALGSLLPCPTTVNPSPNSDVDLAGPIPTSTPQGLTVDDSTDSTADNAITVTNNQVDYGLWNGNNAGPPIVTVNYSKTKSLTVNGGPNTPTITVESTSVPTIINALGTSVVSVCPTSENMSQIGQLTINGSGSTPLTINDSAAAGAAGKTMYYVLSQTSLTRWLRATGSLVKRGTSAPTQLTFSGLENLSFDLTNNVSELDVEGTPASTTIVAGAAAATINVGYYYQNLGNIIGLLDLVGGGSTSANLYDQASASMIPERYTFDSGAVTRKVRQSGNSDVQTTTIDYSNLVGINLWAGQSIANVIGIQGTGPESAPSNAIPSLTPLTVNAGTSSDQITVDAPVINGSQMMGNVTINGAGGKLTLDDSGTQNTDSGFVPNGQEFVTTNKMFFLISGQNVDWQDYVNAVTVNRYGLTMAAFDNFSTTYSEFDATITYSHLQSLTLDGGPVNSAFGVQSTALNTPVSISGAAGTSYQVSEKVVRDIPDITVAANATTNSFLVENASSVKGIHSQVALSGDGSNSTVTVDDSLATAKDQVTIGNGAAGDVQVGMGSKDTLFASGGGLDCTDVGQLTLNLSKSAGDSVQATPSAVTEFFLNGNAAEFPGSNAASLTVAGVIPVPAPTFTSPGAGYYTLTSPLQTVNFTNMQAPTVTGMTPHSGSSGGMMKVIIHGKGFTGATSVMFGSVPAISFSVISSTEITAVVPPEIARIESDYYQDDDENKSVALATIDSTVNVTVTTPMGGPSAPVVADRYTYVWPKALSVTWAPPAPVTFGTALSNDQLDAAANIPGSFTYTPAAGAVLGAGMQDLQATFTPTDTQHYPVTIATVQFLVGQAEPNVTVNSVNIIAGTPLEDSQLGGSATAVVNGQTVNVTGTFTYAGPEGMVLPVGQDQAEQVTFTPDDTTDYQSVTVTAVVNVSGGQITPQVIVDEVDLTYGTVLDNSQLSGTASAVVNGQTVPVPGSFAYTTAAGAVLEGGQGQTEAVAFTPANRAEFTTVSATVTVNVNPVTPLVATNPVNITYGTALADSQLTGTVTAVVNGQTVPVPGIFRYAGGEDGTVLGVGNEQFEEVMFIASDAADFYIANASVIVNVAPSGVNITWNTPAAITYGTALDTTQLDASANVAGTFSYSPAAGAVLNAGTQTLNVTFTPNDTTNYSTTTASVQLVVNPATPTVTLTSSPTPDYYADNLTLTAVVQSSAGTPQGTVTFQSGTQTLGASSLQDVNGSQQATLTLNWLPIGSYSITAVYSDTADSNFATNTSPDLSQSVSATPFGGHALQFSGGNNYVEVPGYNMSLGLTATLAAWIYLQQLPSTAGQSMYIMGQADGADALNLQVGMDNKIHFNANTTSLISNTVLQPGIWYFVAGTYETSASNFSVGQLQLYINGSQDATLSGAFGRATNNTDPFTIGASTFVPGQYFQGYIAAPSVWNIVLSQTAIQSEMTNGLTGNETGLLAYWPFDEGSGTITHDLSPNENNGTLGPSADNEPQWVTLG